METLLRKYLWALDLAVVVLVALFAARATGVMVEAALIRQTPPPKRVVQTSFGATPQTVYSKDTLEILKRNIFCSTCPSLVEEPKKPGDEDKTPQVEVPVRSNLPLRLMAVMFSPPPHDPRWSMAIIRDTNDQAAGPYGIGSVVKGATVEHIEETRVYLRNQGKAEFLDLVDKGPPPPPPGQPPPPAPVAAAPEKDPFAEALEKGIKKTGEHTYEIQKSTLESMLGNMAALSRAARIVPEVKDGRSAGFRLFSIRPEGPFGRIGLQNGDVIVAINGLEMTDPTKALEVYTKLRTASHLSVALERNGSKITKDYNIR